MDLSFKLHLIVTHCVAAGAYLISQLYVYRLTWALAADQNLLWTKAKPEWKWSYTWGEFTEGEITCQIIYIWRIVERQNL